MKKSSPIEQSQKATHKMFCNPKNSPAKPKNRKLITYKKRSNSDIRIFEITVGGHLLEVISAIIAILLIGFHRKHTTACSTIRGRPV